MGCSVTETSWHSGAPSRIIGRTFADLQAAQTLPVLALDTYFTIQRRIGRWKMRRSDRRQQWSARMSFW